MRGTSGKRIFGAIGALIGTLMTICVAYGVYLHIHAGLGAETIRNGYGQYSTWAAYAGKLIAVPFVLLGMFLIGWWQLWRRSRREGVPIRQIRNELKQNCDF
jgi:uncharacterized membrane protein